MSDFLNEYVRNGFTEVFIIKHEKREDPGGFENEHTVQTAVAKKAGRHYRVVVEQHVDFSPRFKDPAPDLSAIEISRAEYAAVSIGRSRVDTPSALLALSQQNAELAREREAEERRIAALPRCPVHDVPMVRRVPTKPRRPEPFWGCPHFPDCRQTRPM